MMHGATGIQSHNSLLKSSSSKIPETEAKSNSVASLGNNIVQPLHSIPTNISSDKLQGASFECHPSTKRAKTVNEWS